MHPKRTKSYKIMWMAFSQSFVWRNGISTALGQWWYHFFTQKVVEMSFPLFWWSKYPFILGGICIYFMQIPASYLFCRKSSNGTGINKRISTNFFVKKWYFHCTRGKKIGMVYEYWINLHIAFVSFIWFVLD